jgi:hypothetical protein
MESALSPFHAEPTQKVSTTFSSTPRMAFVAQPFPSWPRLQPPIPSAAEVYGAGAITTQNSNEYALLLLQTELLLQQVDCCEHLVPKFCTTDFLRGFRAGYGKS